MMFWTNISLKLFIMLHNIVISSAPVFALPLILKRKCRKNPGTKRFIVPPPAARSAGDERSEWGALVFFCKFSVLSSIKMETTSFRTQVTIGYYRTSVHCSTVHVTTVQHSACYYSGIFCT